MKKKILLINFFLVLFIIVTLELVTGYFLRFKNYRNISFLYVLRKFNTKELGITKIKKINELKANNEKRIYPAYLYDPQVHPINSDQYWFGHLPNSGIVHCKESSGWTVFTTNKLGFRKTLNQNLNKPFQLLVLGDSYVEGACVNNPNDIPSQLSLIRNQNVFNAGRGGTGPLFQLGLLKELLATKDNSFSLSKNGKLLWIIFTGNDLKNLAEEKTTLLSNYITDDFELNYFDKLKKLSVEKEYFFKSIFKNLSSNNLIGNHSYGETVVPNSFSQSTALNDLGIIFNEFVKITNRKKIDLNIVILEDHPRYNSEVMIETQKKLKSLCVEKKSKCLFIKMKEFRQNNLFNHLTPSEYKKLSIKISEFLG